MNLKEQLDALLDATAFDSTGTKVGAVRQVYVDDASGKLTFATVSTGIFSADAIVPLHGARLLDDELHVDHTRDVIRDSPRPDNTEDALAPEQELKLLEYYGLEAPATGRGAAEPKPKPEPEKTPEKQPEKRPGKQAEERAETKPEMKSGKQAETKPGSESGGITGTKNKPGAAGPGAAKNSPEKPATAKSAPSPAKKVTTETKDKDAEKSDSPTGPSTKPGGADAGQQTAAAAATPDNKGEGTAPGEEKKATTTTTSAPSPATPPAAMDRTRAGRPGSAAPDTTATSENTGKNASPERD